MSQNILGPNPGGFFPQAPMEPGLIGKILKGIGKVAKYAWSVITGSDEQQNEIAETKGYNPQKSNADEVAELNKLLSEYRDNIISAGKKLESEMIVECCMEMDEIRNIFEEYNQEFKIARSESIKRKFKRMNNEMKGTFSDYIKKKISLDDPECVKILKLPAGEMKQQRLQEMKQEVFVAAEKSIIDKLKDAADDFSYTVQEAFEEHLDRTEQSIQVKIDAFEKLDSSDDKAESSELIALESGYMMALCEYAETLM